MSITTAARYLSGSVPSVTPRRPMPLTDDERAQGYAIRAEIEEIRERHQRELADVEARRNTWLRLMRDEYPDEHRLPSILAAVIGMHRTSVHAILTKGRNVRTRGET